MKTRNKERLEVLYGNIGVKSYISLVESVIKEECSSKVIDVDITKGSISDSIIELNKDVEFDVVNHKLSGVICKSLANDFNPVMAYKDFNEVFTNQEEKELALLIITGAGCEAIFRGMLLNKFNR